MVEGVNLLDVCDIRTGKLDANAMVENGEYPFYTCDRNPFRIDTYAFDCECVLIGGNNATGNFPINYYKGKFNAYQRTYVITVKEGMDINIRYVYHAMKLALLEIKRRSKGSLTKFITLNLLQNVVFPKLTKEQYQDITDRIDAYDNIVIENNTLVSELEEYSQLLFHKWFVDFNFPNEEGKPYKDSGGEMIEVEGKWIPYGWKYRALKEYVCFNKGVSYKSEDIEEGIGMPMVNLNSFNRNGGYKVSGIKYYNGKINPDKLLKPFDLVVACTDVTRNADIIGMPVLLPLNNCEQYIASMDVAHLITTQIECGKFFLSQVLSQSRYNRYIKGFANGTNVLHLNLNGISKFKTVIPDKEVHDKFEEIIEAIEYKKSTICTENLLLEETRDLLIKKLIN